jgi:hypothetical protein
MEEACAERETAIGKEIEVSWCDRGVVRWWDDLMGWFRRLLRRSGHRASPPGGLSDVPLPFLVHTHSKNALPPGPLEEGLVELDQDDMVLHALAGIVQPDGTIHDLPQEKLEWARRLTYRHLKREGCLAEYGIPIIPAYEESDE